MATLYDADGNPIEIEDSLLEGGGDGQQDGPQTPGEFAALRRTKREAAKAAEEAKAAQRELAFMKAGLDPESSKVAGLFYKSYDGDLTKEAIQAAALEIGFKIAGDTSPEAQAAEQAKQQNLAAQSAVAAAAGSPEAAPTAEAVNRKGMTEALAAGGMDALTEYLATQGVPVQEF